MSLSARLRAAAPGQRHRRAIYLHIGAMKTGTTYLQHLMSENSDALARAGFLWPGTTWNDQSLAARDILGRTARRARRSPETEGKWREITEQMMAHDGRGSIYSMEFLSYADEEQARAILDSFPDREIHVILSVRDAREAVPAQWQTSCRMNGTVPLANFIKAMARPADAPNPGRAARLLQRTQGIPRMLDTWAPLVEPGRLHVITVPPRGSEPTLLWRRFAEVVGVRPGLCAPPTGGKHRSLGYPSTELLRLFNVEMERRGRTAEVRPLKKAMVMALGHRVPEESRISLNLRGARLAGRWNNQAREAIVRSGAHLVGSLDDLSVAPPDASLPEALPTPSAAELLAAGRTTYAALVAHRTRLRTALGLDVPEDEVRAPAEEPGDVDAMVTELGDVVEECLALRQREQATPA